MDCTRARQLIDDFIGEKLDYAEAPAFLEHVRGCAECYDDLELNYLIHTALNELEGEDASYSLGTAMKSAMAAAEHRHAAQTRRRVVIYVMMTLGFWAAVFLLLSAIRAGIIVF